MCIFACVRLFGTSCYAIYCVVNLNNSCVLFVCMYVCFVCLFVCMYVCLFVCFVCLYVCLFVCMYVCMYVCMCLFCIHVCLFVCLFLFLFSICYKQHHVALCCIMIFSASNIFLATFTTTVNLIISCNVTMIVIIMYFTL